MLQCKNMLRRSALRVSRLRAGNFDLSDEREVTIQVLSGMGEIDAAAWDRNANPDPDTYDPFVSHAFLKALEDAECVRPETGWQPDEIEVRMRDRHQFGEGTRVLAEAIAESDAFSIAGGGDTLAGPCGVK